MPNNAMKQSLVVSILFLAVLGSFMTSMMLGAVTVSLADVLQALINAEPSNLMQKIVIELRLPRAILAFTAGAGLSLAGVILQTVTRNPLADPYLFGISSGASFGVVLLFSLTGIQAGLVIAGAAFLGSTLAVSLLIALALSVRSSQVEVLLLAGVALSFLFSALTSLLLYWTDPEAISAILFWNLGSFGRADWQWLWLPVTVVLSACAILLLYRRSLNALLLGDESATTVGVNAGRLRVAMLLISSLITAVLVASCGGVGFVGLMIPHIVRFFISQAKVSGLLATFLTGGLFMLWVDIVARSLLDNQELPVGVITASIGSLFFLILLLLRSRTRAL
ncbi:iron ABC transporter permease [Pseudoalteromonas xiamenensis]|uniref:FecCD family ABC transporter permease n=1 Tax=Pseudoalteromonas xiamenensis TaxID=882626 RepID=UPI0027E59199|nr:iron ABC transporter permease [Pseudoalteromonas xiamenensis]WMN59186.1 iron ABC transporter permease [Pseudoalteromonas xiamenensis]